MKYVKKDDPPEGANPDDPAPSKEQVAKQKKMEKE